MSCKFETILIKNYQKATSLHIVHAKSVHYVERSTVHDNCQTMSQWRHLLLDHDPHLIAELRLKNNLKKRGRERSPCIIATPTGWFDRGRRKRQKISHNHISMSHISIIMCESVPTCVNKIVFPIHPHSVFISLLLLRTWP